MTIFNDLDIKNWKKSEIITDSLWLIKKRDTYGKHSGFYHGNFVPQIPHQLILRYTKKNEIVFDPFLGSGTTSIEAEILKRNFIGIDIQPELINIINQKINTKDNFSEFICADSTNKKTFDTVKNILVKYKKTGVQLAILHPPYSNIIKFSNNKNDLSNTYDIGDFLSKFSTVVKNTISILDENRYLAVVIGDKYSGGEWVPLGFYCMDLVQKLGLTLKSVIIKNMEGNRSKQSKDGIWRYRALTSDYYIFKHEYIFVFKN